MVVISLYFIILDLLLYLPAPAHGFRMSPGWSYPDELKVHKIILSQKLSGFNVANLVYDPRSAVQKYLLQKDGVKIDSADYLTNNYLFVIASGDNFLADPAFEIRKFHSGIILSGWQINSLYRLYLVGLKE